MKRWCIAAVVCWVLLMQVSLAWAVPHRPVQPAAIDATTTTTASSTATSTTPPVTTPFPDTTTALRLRRPAPPSTTDADLPPSSADVALPDARGPPVPGCVEAGGSIAPGGGAAVNPRLTQRLAAWQRYKAKYPNADLQTWVRQTDSYRGWGANPATGYGEHVSRVKAYFKIQDHHAIPWDNARFPHQSSPLVRQAGVDLKTYGPGIRPLGGHSGPQPVAYHRAIQQRLRLGGRRVSGQGADAARTELDRIIGGIWDDIGSGRLRPYDTKDVWIP